MGFPQPDTGAVTEDTGLVGGLLTTSGDIDFGPFFNNDAGQWTAQTLTGAYGSTLVIDSNGAWTYSADNANASIQALNTGTTLTEVFTVSSSRGTSTITITVNGLDEPPCFAAGTLIDTPHGPRPIEALRAGDAVITRDNGVQQITWAGARALAAADCAPDLRPIRIQKDALAPGVPDADLLVSPMHKLLIRSPSLSLVTGHDEVFCAARHLVNGQTINIEPARDVTYHHILFDTHQVLRSSGCASESLLPGEIGLNGFDAAARQEVLALFPQLRASPDGYGPAVRPVAKKFEAIMIRDHFTPAGGFWNDIYSRVA